MSRSRITSKGQITIPKEVRERLGLEAGDALEFRFEGDRLEAVPIRRRSIADFRGRFSVPRAFSLREEREHYRKSLGKDSDTTNSDSNA